MSNRDQWWRPLVARRTTVVGLVMMTIVAIAVLAAPWIASVGPTEPDYDSLLQGPSHRHWFGTDDLGRDIFSRVLNGGRATLVIAIATVAIALAVGTLLGLVTGYFGGRLDALLMRLIDVWLSFPAFLLLLSIVAALGPGLGTIVIAIAVASIPTYARAVRGAVLAVRNLEFVEAARLSGSRHVRIMTGHLLPGVAGVLAVYTSLGLGGVILATTGLNFLGLGVQPPSPEWGAMLAVGNDYLRDAWWMSVFPGAAIFLTVVSINLVGAGLRDVFDPRTVARAR